jgi:hypothetical protein
MRPSDDMKVVGRAECIGVDARPPGVDIDFNPYVRDWVRDVLKMKKVLGIPKTFDTP